MKVITVSGQVEKLVADHIKQTEHGSYLTLDPEKQQAVLRSTAEQVERVTLQEETAVLLCSPAVRMYMKQLLGRALPQVVVLSYNELDPGAEVQSVGVVNVS